MRLGRLRTLALCLGAVAPVLAAWPNAPFKSSGRWIVDSTGANVSFAGANWPAAAETMIPEGLQYQSIQSIVSKLKDLGMNVIRLTWAVEMVDQIYENGGKDVLLKSAFTSALGQDNGTAIFNKVIKNNPQFSETTTRLQVFDAVAAECAKQQIFVHLDNHNSKATWSGGVFDGNGWWGATYFSTANWTRGLAYMADHGKSWPNLVSMALRNEPRPDNPSDPYTLQTWYTRMKQGAGAVRSNNSDVLILISSTNGDLDLSAPVEGSVMTPGTEKFTFNDFKGYSDKLVFELHIYDQFNNINNCTQMQQDMFKHGFETLTSNAKIQLPLVITEFGFEQNATRWKGVYPTCLASYLPVQKVGWMIWVLSGSYYIREGQQDSDETWGLLNHDWSDFRSADYISGGLKPLIKDTLAWGASGGQSGGGGGGGGGTSTGGSAGASPSQTGKPNSQPRQAMGLRWPLLMAYTLLMCSLVILW